MNEKEQGWSRRPFLKVLIVRSTEHHISNKSGMLSDAPSNWLHLVQYSAYFRNLLAANAFQNEIHDAAVTAGTPAQQET